MRTFRDSSGNSWTVWDTVRSSDTPVMAALADGWLTFECEASKRRLAPIPRDWERVPESELAKLLERAERVTPAPAPKGWRSAAGGKSASPPAAAPSAPPAHAPEPAARSRTVAAGPPQGASLRTFTDSTGLAWSVWAVRPGIGPNASETADRRRAAAASSGPGPQGERRLQVRSEFSGGWLAFHGANGARRRLMPIPERWETLADGELEQRCRDARPMPDAER